MDRTTVKRIYILILFASLTLTAFIFSSFATPVIAKNTEDILEKITVEDVNFYEYAIGEIKSTLNLMDTEMTKATGMEYNLNSIFEECIDEVLNYFEGVKSESDALDKFEELINEKGGILN